MFSDRGLAGLVDKAIGPGFESKIHYLVKWQHRKDVCDYYLYVIFENRTFSDDFLENNFIWELETNLLEGLTGFSFIQPRQVQILIIFEFISF
ncbi:hypothetical protein AVEN_214303-1 [Araneus ventricosus]|uniref:Uncharacterized protein n=1 Tax=Araneus ventricosus TaxID=182803 RepID=A0A4Y2J6B5_ARAVE|nr:hypothetical protein AVEN_214303-1 [Araneus ventricosus]